MKSRLMCVDVETGGLDAERHALLSVAAVDSLNGDTFHALISPRPDGIVEEQAVRVNGLTPEKLAGAAGEREVMAQLCLWLVRRSDAVLAGCNVSFDQGFLLAACARAGLKWPMSHRTVDVRGVAWTAWEAGKIDLPLHGRSGQPKLDLNTIAGACGISRSAETHDALEDAQLTLECFRHLTAALA